MAKLALNGGPKVVDRPIGRSWPIFDETEKQVLIEVLESGRWWRGAYERAEESKVGQFENAFAAFQDAKHGVACTNGTQAIELALKACGIRPGDEVIVPAATFVATATAVLLTNGVPVIVDIEPNSYQIDPDAVEAAITARTVGIIPVHYGGYPADMDRLRDIAARHGLFLVEDCAHAHGSQWKGVGVGALGDCGAFSLQMGKTLTCGEGGIVLTNDDQLAAKLFAFHHIGRIADRPFYEHHYTASNLRMTEWQGAVALAQLGRLQEQTQTREANERRFRAGLEEIEGLAPLVRDERVTRWGFYFYHFKYLADQWDGIPRSRFFEACAAEGLNMHTGHTHPIYRNPLFESRSFGPVGWPPDVRQIDYTQVRCPEAERIYETEACCLSHAIFLGDPCDMDLMVAVLWKVRDNMDELR